MPTAVRNARASRSASPSSACSTQTDTQALQSAALRRPQGLPGPLETFAAPYVFEGDATATGLPIRRRHRHQARRTFSIVDFGTCTAAGLRFQTQGVRSPALVRFLSSPPSVRRESPTRWQGCDIDCTSRAKHPRDATRASSTQEWMSRGRGARQHDLRTCVGRLYTPATVSSKRRARDHERVYPNALLPLGSCSYRCGDAKCCSRPHRAPR